MNFKSVNTYFMNASIMFIWLDASYYVYNHTYHFRNCASNDGSRYHKTWIYQDTSMNILTLFTYYKSWIEGEMDHEKLDKEGSK